MGTQRMDARSSEVGTGGRGRGQRTRNLSAEPGRPASKARSHQLAPRHTPRPALPQPALAPSPLTRSGPHPCFTGPGGRARRSRLRGQGPWPVGLSAVPAGSRARRARRWVRLRGLCPPFPGREGEGGKEVKSRFPSGTGKVPETPRRAPSSPPLGALPRRQFGHFRNAALWGPQHGDKRDRVLPWGRGTV